MGVHLLAHWDERVVPGGCGNYPAGQVSGGGIKRDFVAAGFADNGNGVAMRKQQHSRAGAAFTLLEVMVALAFVAILIVGIYSCWYSILKGSQVGKEAAASTQRSRIAMRTVQDALLCACMYSQ